MRSLRHFFVPRALFLLLMGGTACTLVATGGAETRYRPGAYGDRRVRRRAPPAPARSQPLVTSFGPASGPPATVVVVNGERLDLVSRALIGHRPLAILRLEPHRLELRIPEGAVSERLVLITRDNTQLVLDPPFVVQYATPAPPPAPAPAPAPPPPVGGAVNIIGFSPLQGPPGTVVRITGRGFLPEDQIHLGKALQPARSRGADFIEVVITPGVSAPFVLVGPGGRRAASPVGFALTAAPTITGFSPAQGPAGTVVRVTGRDFLPEDQIFLGQTVQPARSRGADFIEVVITPGVSAPFALVGPGGRRAASAVGFALTAAPTITGFSPAQGPAGTLVRVSGRDFLPQDQIYLGQTLQPARSRGADFIEIVITPGTSAPFVLVGPGGRRAASAVGFALTAAPTITGFSPAQGPSGTLVRVSGRDFLPQDQIYLGQTLQPARSRGADFIEIVITPGTSAPFVLVGPGGRRAASPHGFSLRSPEPAFSFSVTPTSGAAGTEVTLTVAPARPTAAVYFGGVALPKQVQAGGSALVVTIPVGAQSGYFELEADGQRLRGTQLFTVFR